MGARARWRKLASARRRKCTLPRSTRLASGAAPMLTRQVHFLQPEAAPCAEMRSSPPPPLRRRGPGDTPCSRGGWSSRVASAASRGGAATFGASSVASQRSRRRRSPAPPPSCMGRREATAAAVARTASMVRPGSIAIRGWRPRLGSRGAACLPGAGASSPADDGGGFLASAFDSKRVQEHEAQKRLARRLWERNERRRARRRQDPLAELDAPPSPAPATASSESGTGKWSRSASTSALERRKLSAALMNEPRPVTEVAR